jgi:predicted flap endonuclease-1-like 5' DNA nuclease
MGAVLSTILISAPLAFMAGWLIAKAVFQHLSVTRPNATLPMATSAPTRDVKAAAPAEGEPEAAFNQLRVLKKQLTAADTRNQTSSNEIQTLREALAEREQRMLELAEKLQVAHTLPEDTQAGALAVQDARFAKQLREQHQRVEHVEQENTVLRREVIGVEKRLGYATTRFHKWRVRFSPLAKQFRQQKLIINELRDELRRRDQEAPLQPQLTAASTPPPVVMQQPNVAPEELEQQLRDNLEQLHGIGPALHRKLNERGIYRLQQLAHLDINELLQLGKSVGVSDKQVRKHSWSAQAQALLRQLGQPGQPRQPAANTARATVTIA